MQSHWTPLAALLLGAACGSSQAAPSADFGVNVTFYGRSHLQTDAMLAAGVTWVRTDLAWSAAETSPGHYDFSTWERQVEAYTAQGIRPILILDYGNELYEDQLPPSTSAGREAFAAFAQAAASTFRGRVVWEIWNEPNVPTYWAGSPNPRDYVQLARSAALAIRRADPQAQVWGPALGGERFDIEYLKATFELGLLEFVDAVSVHPYAADTPEAALPFYDTVRELMAGRKLQRDIPIVVTEWGYATDRLGPALQAEYLMRALATNRQAGIPVTVWYSWQEPVLPWNSFGLLDVKGRSKPAYDALVSSTSGAAAARLRSQHRRLQ